MFSRCLIRGVVGLLCLHATVGAAAAQLVDTAPWPMFQHDNAHTGQSGLAGPSGDAAVVKWAHKAVAWPKTEPAVDEDGTIYYAAGFVSLCAVNPVNGAKKWCGPKSGDANTSSPAIGESIYPGFDRTIYRGARDNKLWSINTDGSWNWSFKIPLDGDVMSSVAIAADGTIYTACGCLSRGIVLAMNPDGTVKWELSIGQAINNSSPAIGPGGRIYIGAANGALFAIDDLGNQGQVVWNKKASGATRNKNSSPSLRQSGLNTIIYLGSNVGLSAFRDNGASASVLWTRATVGDVDTTPAISSNGTGMIVVSSWKGAPARRTVYAFDFDGNQVWVPFSGPSTQTTAHAQSPSAVIDVDGNVYQAVGKTVYALAPNGSTLWTHTLPSDAIAMALGNAVLYVGAKNSYLYALENP